MLLLGLDQVGHSDVVGLRAGVSLDFAHKGVVDGQADVVAEGAFFAVDAIGGVGVGGAAEAVGPFLLGRALADLDDAALLVANDLEVIGNRFVE